MTREVEKAEEKEVKKKKTKKKKMMMKKRKKRNSRGRRSTNKKQKIFYFTCLDFGIDCIGDFVGQRERGDDSRGPVQQEDAHERPEEEQHP